LLAAIFVFAGVYVGTEEALEDSLAAELLPKEQHGMAFGTLAAVNAVGDFLSSIVVGLLWSQVSVKCGVFIFGGVVFCGGDFDRQVGENSGGEKAADARNKRRERKAKAPASEGGRYKRQRPKTGLKAGHYRRSRLLCDLAVRN